jgi:tyrosine-protein kinase Etk/Wzc
MTTKIPLSDVDEHAETPLAVEGKADRDDDVSLLDLLILLAQRKHIVFGVTATFAILAIGISLILPKSYTGQVTLLPPQDSTSMSSSISSQLGGVAAILGSGLGFKNSNEMYVAMFKSQTVENAMVQHFGLMQEYHAKYLSDARNTFESHVKVDGTNKDGLIHISVDDPDPRRAAELANGYIDQFRGLSQHLAITEAAQRRLFFERELQEAKDNLANAEEALKRTEQTTGVMQVDLQARALTESAAALRAQITAKKVQIEGLETYATGENAQLMQAQRELDSLRTQLAKVGGSEDSPGSELVIPKGRVPEAGLEYLRKLRDVKYYETIFEILARLFEAAKLDEAKQGAIIQVVDPATVPDRRSFPKRGLIVIVATAAGLFLGFLVALVHAVFQHLNSDPGNRVKFYELRRALSLRRARSSRGAA